MTNIVTSLRGYLVLEKIYEGLRAAVYRGQRLVDRQPVVIKFLRREYPDLAELVRFRNQYLITKKLALAGTVKSYSLETCGNGLAIVMEDFGGISLTDYLATKNCQELASNYLADFWQIAIQLTQILEQIHQQKIIHKDIKPQNILINPNTKQVKLIDFSIASLLPRENQQQLNLNALEGTLAYMSPEQTGRMNRGIDYRTDFYSLGITFYQLLTGKLPFATADSLELIHSHLARVPTPPQQINSAIPNPVGDIVLKLMAKTPEERYQSAAGLHYDLQTCQKQWEATKQIAPFGLGLRDISDRFTIPEKLYGREREVKTLLNTYERVSRGNAAIILVAGFSGVGKTSLIDEIHKPIVRQQGYFIKGKFEQFQRNIPFSGIVRALRDLIAQLLTENPEKLKQWKLELLKALGENGRVIIDVIPELETIIGKQPGLVELEPSAAQNRFNLVFSNFLRVFATKDHPLVIFLDDLHWADLASLKLIQLLLDVGQISYLLIIGAYRDNEVNPTHPLILTIAEMEQNLYACRDTSTVTATEKSEPLAKIVLSPLNFHALNCLIADTLSCTTTLALPLTELVFQKTQGNPFFTIQLLQSLYQEGLISFDEINRCWQCDIAQIEVLCVSDDVVKFMAERLQKLPKNTQDVLKLAACLGNQFDLNTLAIAYRKSPTDTTEDLWQALQEGLILPISEIYKFFLDADSAEVPQIENLSVPYRFLHDRVQQAAYSLLANEEKPAIHLQIGQLLLQHTSEVEREEKIFEIVNHLNLGKKLIDCREKREELAQLNLIAGRKALDATAHAAAYNYCSMGRQLLARDCWQQQYKLTLDLFVAEAKAAYLYGKFEQMERAIATVLKQGQSLLDRVKAYEVQIHARIAQGKPLEAVETALKVLQLLGVNLPQKPSKGKILLALIATKLSLAGKQIDDLSQLPQMTDPIKLAAGQIMLSAASAINLTIPELIPLLALKGVNLSVRYGNDSMSAYGYAGYGAILCGFLGEIDAGYEFGKLALKLLAKLNAKKLKARTFMVFNNFIRHWKEHLREGLKPLLEAYTSGLETGDLEYAAYAAYMHCYHSYLLGKELSQLEKKIEIYDQAIARLGQQAVLPMLQLYQQVVLNLLGRAENPCCLIGESYDEQVVLERLQQVNHISAIFDIYCHKLILCYLFEEYLQACEHGAIAEQYSDAAMGTPLFFIFHFYNSLAQLAVYTEVSASEQKRILKKVNNNQKKFQKWARHAPMNHLHKFYLIEAERHRVFNQKLQALENYDRAIELAEKNQYVNEQALAQELAGKFYLSWGKEQIARLYLTEAYYSYARWGATAKVKDLTHRYSQFLSVLAQEPVSLLPTAISSISSSKNYTFQIDLAAVIKASQAIAREIQLNKLLSTLMEVIIENAGAQTGYLILFHQEPPKKLVVEAKMIAQSIQITTLRSQLIRANEKFPDTVVNYVQSTLKPVILGKAATEKIFAADPYIMEHQPKSILCIPVLNQNRLIGIFYLENNLIDNAFTQKCLEVLNVLCSQGAIALENARLYHNLKRSQARERDKANRLEKSLQTLHQTQAKLLKIQKKLKHDAFHDSLTGLPNRAWFMNLLERAIKMAARYPNYLYAVLFLDLDRFKLVNDSLGHLIGDKLLKSVAQRLQKCLRASDTVARLGGDEFAILLEELENSQEAILVAQRIQEQLTQPFKIAQYEIYTGTSIGITHSTEGYEQPEEVLRDADAAMYRVKDRGKGHYFVFNRGLRR